MPENNQNQRPRDNGDLTTEDKLKLIAEQNAIVSPDTVSIIRLPTMVERVIGEYTSNPYLEPTSKNSARPRGALFSRLKENNQ